MIDWQSAETVNLSRVPSEKLPELKSHVWLQTSGSSGKSKAIALSKEGILKSAATVNEWVSSNSVDKWGIFLPTHHIGGLSILARSHLSGASFADFSIKKWNVHEAVIQIESSGVTLVSLVPTQIHDLVSIQAKAPKSLRTVFVGGGRLKDELLESAVQLGWPIVLTYGMTEASSQVASTKPNGSDLIVLPHLEARVSIEKKLEIKGPSVLTGFIEDNKGQWHFKDPKREGWFETSDRVRIEGRKLTWLGRSDRLVKCRGKLIDLDALEFQIGLELPQDLAAAFFVSSKGHLRDENEVMIVVSKSDLLRFKELLNSVFSKLNLIEVPISLFPVDELLKTPLGKWDRERTLNRP